MGEKITRCCARGKYLGRVNAGEWKRAHLVTEKKKRIIIMCQENTTRQENESLHCNDHENTARDTDPETIVLGKI